MQKSGRLDQTASRVERAALRWAIVASATYVPANTVVGQNQFDVYVEAREGDRVYLGRVGEAAYGDMPREKIELGWGYKFADDVFAGQPWQSGRGIKSRELAAYRLLPTEI